MTDKKTPIPLRASRKAPEPITFPTARYGSNATPVDANLNPIDTPIAEPGSAWVNDFRQMVGLWVRDEMHSKEYSNYIADCIATTIYKALDLPDIEIIDMGEEQFKAFCRSVLEDAE